MKKLLKTNTVSMRNIAILGLLFFQSVIWAQEKDVDVSLNIDKGTTTTTEWYSEPWMWVVGGAVFLIIVIALVSGKK